MGDYAFAYTALTSADLTAATYVGTHAFLKEELTDFTVTLGEGVEAPFEGDRLSALLAALAEDPRPSYQEDPERIYRMRYANCEVLFTVCEKSLTVVGFS